MNINLITIILAQVFGIISWLLLLYSYTKEDIDELLYIQILVCLFDVISYFLLGADAGLLICLVELIKTILYYKTDKDRLIFRVGLVFYIMIGFLTIRTWYAILPVVASVIDSFGVSKDSKSANICSIISNTLWTIYDILILSYIGALNDVVVIICNISVLFLGYSRIMHITKFRIVKYNYLTKNTLNKIFNLDKKNFGEDNTWDKKYQLDVYKKNKDSLFVIKYKHEFVGYINYINIIEEEYERLKRIRKIPDIIDLNKIIKFKTNRKNYILIESINIKKEYEKEQSIELIHKKIKSFINIKHRQRVYINGIIFFATSKFEKEICEYMKCTKLKDVEDNTSIYELSIEEIRKDYLA